MSANLTSERDRDVLRSFARRIDPSDPGAHNNLGVLYKAFIAPKNEFGPPAQDSYRKARGFFQEYLSKDNLEADDREEANQNIKDCDKVIKQIDDFIKNMAAMPPMPPTPPAPAPGG